MSDLMNRVLMAYRPLYLRGLLMDGQYRFPTNDQPTRGHRQPPAARSALLASHAIAVAARRPASA